MSILSIFYYIGTSRSYFHISGGSKPDGHLPCNLYIDTLDVPTCPGNCPVTHSVWKVWNTMTLHSLCFLDCWILQSLREGCIDSHCLALPSNFLPPFSPQPPIPNSNVSLFNNFYFYLTIFHDIIIIFYWSIIFFPVWI